MKVTDQGAAPPFKATTAIVRAPLRISFVGGGSDLSEYSDRFGGLAIGCAIAKFNYVHLCGPILNGADAAQSTGWVYSATKNLPPTSEVGGRAIIEEALRRADLSGAYICMSISDLMELGSGLGSSSALAVASVIAASHCAGVHLPPRTVAERAFLLEREGLSAPVGRQDHVMSAYGGLALYEFHQEGDVSRHDICLAPGVYQEIEAWMGIVQIPRALSANEILADHSAGLRTGHYQLQAQHQIKRLVEPFAKALEASDMAKAAEILDRAWCIKRTLAKGITTTMVDELYQRARAAGALGGKLLGAGGGGHLLLLSPPERWKSVSAALYPRVIEHFTIDSVGATILNSRDRTHDPHFC